MSDLSFFPNYQTLDEAISNNFYIPTIEIMEYPEEPIFEISGGDSVDDIKEKLIYILKYKEELQTVNDNNTKYMNQQRDLTNMFWADCFITSNINILPKKIKEAIIEMIIEKAKELNYMGNFYELRKLFDLFSKEMVENFSQIGKKNEEVLELTPEMIEK